MAFSWHLTWCFNIFLGCYTKGIMLLFKRPASAALTLSSMPAESFQNCIIITSERKHLHVACKIYILMEFGFLDDRTFPGSYRSTAFLIVSSFSIHRNSFRICINVLRSWWKLCVNNHSSIYNLKQNGASYVTNVRVPSRQTECFYFICR